MNHTATMPRRRRAKALPAQAFATAMQFRALSAQLATLRAKSALMRDVLRERGPGVYEEATVYRVKSHQVRGYWREGWVGVRAKRQES